MHGIPIKMVSLLIFVGALLEDFHKLFILKELPPQTKIICKSILYLSNSCNSSTSLSHISTASTVISDCCADWAVGVGEGPLRDSMSLPRGTIRTSLTQILSCYHLNRMVVSKQEQVLSLLPPPVDRFLGPDSEV